MAFMSNREVNADAYVIKVTEEPGDTISTTRITVGTTSVTLIAVNTNRRNLMLRNLSATGTIYITGTSPATTTTSFPILPGEVLGDLRYSGNLYAIASEAGVSIALFEIIA